MALTNLNSQSTAWTLQSVNTAQQGRFHMGALFPAAAATTGMTAWRDGVVVSTNQGGSNSIPNDMQIKPITPTPSMSLTCEAGSCVITRTGQGPYLCYLPTQGTLTLAAADPTNPRIDRIVAQVYDSALGDTLPTTPTLSSPGGLVIRAVTGTPAGSPVAPALPTGAITLATVAVAANATQITSGNITDARKSCVTRGSSARTLLPGDLSSDAGAVSGELRYTVGTKQMDVWDGSAWTPPGLGGVARFNQTSAQSPIAVAAVWTKVAFPNVVTAHADVTQTNSTDYVINRTGWWKIAARNRVATTNVDGIRFQYGIYTTANASSGTSPLAVITQIETDAQIWSTNLAVSTEEIRITAGTSISVALRKDGTRVGSVATAGGGNNSASEVTGFTDQNSLTIAWVGP